MQIFWQTTGSYEYHALIDALGHYICLRHKPRCQECPLRGICACAAEKGVPGSHDESMLAVPGR